MNQNNLAICTQYPFHCSGQSEIYSLIAIERKTFCWSIGCFRKRGADNSGLVNGAVKIQIPTNQRVYQGHSNKQHQTSWKHQKMHHVFVTKKKFDRLNTKIMLNRDIYSGRPRQTYKRTSGVDLEFGSLPSKK